MQTPKNAAILLGSAIQKQRKSLSLTQAQLGRFAGCGTAFIYNLEHGKISIRFDKLLSVLAVLGLQLTVQTGKEQVVIGESKQS